MTNPHGRYFIELQPRAGEENAPRSRETEIRRRMALDFLTTIKEWLQDNDLGEKVSTLSVTAFGQIQITCEPSVINLIRNQDVVNIAAIRPGVYTEHFARWNEAR
jgi:hypothetical protein